MAKRGLRRLVSVPTVFLMAAVLTVTAPLWATATFIVDLTRGRWRLPTVRLLCFGWWWAWAETGGIVALGCLWVLGQAGRNRVQYWVQRWWCAWIISSLRHSVGMKLDMTLDSPRVDRPLVVLFRHASLADAIISCYVVNNRLGMDPRYVLKSELMSVPCLDILGHRTPNCFVTRGTATPEEEIAAVARMVAGMGAGECAVIFPEGSRASDKKRSKELGRLAERHPERHSRLGGLQHLIPPKTAGVAALLASAPTADVMTVWHHGLEGMDTFGGILRSISRRRPVVTVVGEIHPRESVPGNEEFAGWLDNQWVRMDAEVSAHEATAARKRS